MIQGRVEITRGEKDKSKKNHLVPFRVFPL